jgi:AraC-like DNA-binding protein
MSDQQVVYRVQRATAGDDATPVGSIMFSESQRLIVHGHKGALMTELMTIGSSGVTVGRVASSGHEIELREAENITFLMPRSGRLDIRIGDREHRVLSRQGMVIRPTERRTRSTPDRTGRFLASTLQVPVARIRALAQSAIHPSDRALAHEAQALRGEVAGFLLHHLPRLVDDLLMRPSQAPPERVVRALATLVDEQLYELLGHLASVSIARRTLPALHRVRAAEEIMHAYSDDPLSMLDVAQTLGVSLRSLQLAFNEVYGGLSPRDVLNRIRLEKARRRLMAADGEGQVTTIALDSGFFHLSRFAQAYARVYGEKPSETLSRRRA